MGTPACAECDRNCLLIHGKNKDPSPVVQSFFKIMIGDNFSKVLFLPPKIGRTMPNLASKETQLEDASGQRWTVTLSWREESLAFHQGWASFSREHGLEVGDLLVFHYILGSHFVVQIYGKNGCERLHFSAENGSRKKRRKNTPSAAKDGKYHSTDRNTMNEQDQVASVLSGSNMEIVTDNALITANGSPRKMLNEVQLCMIGMEARHRHEDHRNSLYDLSNFEMQRTSDVDGTAVVLEHEWSPCDGNILLTSQAGADIVDRIPATEKVVAPDVPNLEVPEANEDFQVTEKVVLVSTKDSGDGNTIGGEQSEKTKSSSYQILIPQTEDTPIMPSCQSAPQKSAGEKINEAKTKQLEMKTEVCGFRDIVNEKYPEPKDSGNSSNHPAKKEDYVFKAVKTEPVDTSDSLSADSGTTSLMVAETKAFLELPRRLPKVKPKGQGDSGSRRAVVLLRDPESRLWPVVYHEKSQIKALTSGWEAFVKENSIQPGDECAFEVENECEGTSKNEREVIFKVGIVRK
ncbi:B3 domain-containing protein Os02g0598200-like isoform X4 [Rhododendron vialii]|uniref:B3 domain-containing protein Os02g0598200-like isoform X4 n=1 Tax=Rhododendron vialii TaxID=182163 RepID=UPI00265E8D43|nr:B3 domain-containing protein Os02g0598200-like isoform X4 [Rhododendron vialii]